MLSRVLAGNRNNALALYRMASVCLKLREPLEAKKWAETLRSIEKGNADALILLARTNLALGQPQQAIDNLHAALRLDPRDLDLRNDLGNLYLESKQPEKANEQFKLVLKTDPVNVQALNGAAMCDYTGGNLQTAEASLLQALRIQPSDPQTRMNLALLYSRQNRKEEAIRLYRDIISSSDTPSDWKEEASRRLNKLQ
jgi:tetratricopeptide (TPR) repeat protein